MKSHNDLTSTERKILEEKIDIEFEKKILKPREEMVIEFLIKVLSFQYEFRTKRDTSQIKVISLYYYASSPLSFLFVEPCYAFYSNEYTIDRPELELEDYDYFDLEDLARNVLDESGIDYSDLDQNNRFDLAEFWENKAELEKTFIFNCWKKAKSQTESKLIGFLDASDYSGGTYDLNNGKSLWEDKIEIDDYLDKLGIKINKEYNQ
ncbi:hypothetical protein ACFQ1R_13110 [Mariniflexile jejuense]|uniref:DUF4065 domain-containing protein n=1 Tax=Mariniflexile jejuense TaxID=1173582 RepID=A0ABW3JNB6_9FLAO